MDLFPLTGKEWLIADTHFGHDRIIEYIKSRTPYTESYILKRWKEKVKPGDVVLHLGDFIFRSENFGKYLPKLKGRIYLIAGNHDKRDPSLYESHGITLIKGIHVYLDGEYRHIQPEHKLSNAIITEVCGRRVMFSHFPVINTIPYDEKFRNTTEELYSYFEEFRCEINIHGHIHDWLIHDKRLINACVEYRSFEPVRIEELIPKRTQRIY